MRQLTDTHTDTQIHEQTMAVLLSTEFVCVDLELFVMCKTLLLFTMISDCKEFIVCCVFACACVCVWMPMLITCAMLHERATVLEPQILCCCCCR